MAADEQPAEAIVDPATLGDASVDPVTQDQATPAADAQSSGDGQSETEAIESKENGEAVHKRSAYSLNSSNHKRDR